MPPAYPIQSSLNAGEFSPRMVARTDFAKYPLACATLENMLPLPQGGAARRPGTRFVSEVKDSTRKVKLRPFEFSTIQAYVLECGEGYFRFCTDQGQIVVSVTDAVIANGKFDANISGWTVGAATHDATNGRLNLDGVASYAEQSITTIYTGQEHVLRFRVFGAPGDGIKLRIGTTSNGEEIFPDTDFAVGWHCKAFTPTVSPFYVRFRNDVAKTLQLDDVLLIDGAPVEVGGPYPEADLFEVKQAQSADVLYLCHPSHPVHKLTRTGHTSWSAIEVAFADGPYLERNDSATTLTPSALSGFGVTITASAVEGINDGVGFVASDVGRAVRISNPASGTEWGWAVVTAFTDATHVFADIKRAFATTNASDAWRLGAWCDECGYPGAVTFQEQRLCFAATSRQPQSFWMSQSGDFQNMSPDSANPVDDKWSGAVEDDDALDFTISADQVNAIRWMASGRSLFLGTVGGEWAVTSSGPAITPADVDVKRQTTFGSANLPPQLMRGRLMFLQRASRKLMEFAFSLERDNFQALDLNILSEHVTTGGIVDLAYQQEPDSTLWTVRADGQVPALTYQPDQNVVGWARCRIGGESAACETLAVIPGSGRDEVWFCVRRTIGGQTKRHIEYLGTAFEHGDDQALACYADAALIHDGAPIDSISGLEHVEGEQVVILADGAIHPPKFVSGGAVTLDYPASKIVVGLPYTHTYESLKWEAGNPAGTAQGQVKRIHGVTLILLDALNARVGPDSFNLKSIPFRTVDHQMDAAVPLFTGEKFIEFDGDFATDTRVLLTGSDPVPFTLLAIAPEIKTNAR